MPDVSRRSFVRAAGTLAAAAPAIRKVRAAGNQVQFGFIGTGSRGQYLLKHMKDNDLGQCVAVCDIYPPAAQKAAAATGQNPKIFKDYRELLSQKDVDCVLVATPLFQHYPATRDALLAGKHVFCEKSLVFKPEEVHGLRALAAERPKQILQVGLQRRYSKFYQTARQMIEKGILGKVTNVSAQWHRNTFSRDPWNRAVPAGLTDRQHNWRKYKEYSGGLTAELASHQIDVADWMFGSHPEFVVGVGGTDHVKDGRDIYDNIQLIFKYPQGQKLVYTSISTSQHLPLFGGTRNQFGELILGTEGSIEITVGTDDEPAIGLWYREPPKANVTPAAAKKEAPAAAGATLASTGKGIRSFPILLDKDQITGSESFIEKELKFARRWLYSKGVMVPEEDKNPVDVELAAFLDCVKTGKRPLADLEVGLGDSISVMLANLCMDEGRRVYYSEIDKMGRRG
ncbi:MAG: Gfo/Idh/MocA family protein [Bryobacteraceae bacterium]